MDNEKNEGLKIEDISIDKSSMKKFSLKDQILKLAQGKKVKEERAMARSLLDELEEMSKESRAEDIDVGTIEVGTIEVGKEISVKNKPEDSREERD